MFITNNHASFHLRYKNNLAKHQKVSKYITTQEFNKVTAENFVARLAQANLASKKDVANFDK